MPSSAGRLSAVPARRTSASLLEAAVDAVVRAWDVAEGFQLSEEAVRAAAGDVAAAVRGEMSGAVPAVADLPPWVAAQRLPERLRAAWVAALRPHASEFDAQDILDVAHAFDVVTTQIDRECAQRFVGRIAGPDAARLIVELAHDMRSAMGSILFLSDTLRSGQSGPVTPVQARQLGLIYSAALGLSGIVSDVVDIGRGANRLLEAEPVPLRLEDVITGVITIVRPTAEEKGLAVTVELPEVGTRRGHPAALTRILLNLITNGLKFTETGGVTLSVRRGAGDQLRFEVSDTGRGMPADRVGALLEAFRARGGSGGEYFSGSGLGLTMCQTLLSRMGSSLDVTSREGHGTTFAFDVVMPFAELL